MMLLIARRGLGEQVTTACCAMAIAASLSHFVIASSLPAQQLRVDALKTEYQRDAIGLDVRAPRLSWRIQAARRGTMQSAYQIRVATDSRRSSRHRCGTRTRCTRERPFCARMADRR